MKMKNIFAVASAGLTLLSLVACNTLIPVPTPTQPSPTQTAEAVTATDVQYYFVTNKLLLPTTQVQTKEFGLNVDGDSQNQADNKFGELLTLLTSAAQNLELQATLDQAVNTGQLVTLHVVQADDLLNDPNVSWSIFMGQSTQSSPKFDGSDKLTLDPAFPINTPLVGSLTNGRYVGGPGMSHVKMVLLGQLVDVDLIGVHLEADFSAQGCANGKIGGGVSADEFQGNLLPAISEGINQITKADQATANILLPVFDSDGNGTISTQELKGNPLLMIALSPDLDLLDAAGNFNPNQDGVKDSYSIGLGFTCVPVDFTVPGN